MHKPLPFIPKPFPPHALKDVPEAYIVSQLRHLAQNYWYKPESGDCTIISPVDDSALESVSSIPEPDPLKTGLFANQPCSAGIPTGTGIRIKTRRLVLRLHHQYLAAQSTFFRSLLNGLSPFDDADAFSSEVPRSHLSAGAFPVHPSRRPRILHSSSAHHPVFYVPVPDSASFPHLIHYLYFGTFHYIEECLHRDIITWDGLVRNVEYLGMRIELKAFLGRYYREWLRPASPNSIEDDDAESSDGEGSCISIHSHSSRHALRSSLPPSR